MTQNKLDLFVSGLKAYGEWQRGTTHSLISALYVVKLLMY